MNSIFELDFSRWEILLLFFVPALISIGLFVYTLFFLSDSKTNFAFSMYVMVVGLWQLTEGFGRLSMSVDVAREWFTVSAVFVIFSTPFGLLFTLHFFNPELKIPKSVFISQFIPAILSSFVLITGSEHNTLEASPDVYWVLHPSATVVNYIIYTWISLDGLIMLAILWWNWNRQRKQQGVRKKYALLLAIGFTIPLFGGVVGEVLYPLIAHSTSLPVTIPLFTFFSIACLISILRHNMLDYSPKHQWEEIVEKLNEGIMIIDLTDRIMYTNKAFCKVLGYEMKEINGMLSGDLFKDMEGRSINDILLNEASLDCELMRKDGAHKWMVVSGSPYLDNQGKVIGAIGIFTNITNLKKAKEDIVMEKEKLKLAIDAGKMTTLEVDFFKNTLNLSDNAKHVLGVDMVPDQDFGIDQNIHPDDRQLVRDSMKRTLEGNLGELQFRFIRPDNGECIWLERRAEIVRDIYGNVTGLRGLLMDVTQRKMTESKLFQNTERLKAIFDNEPECVTVISLEGNFEDINPAGLYVLEVADMEEIRQQPIIGFIHPEDREIYQELHGKVSQGNQDTADFRVIGRKRY
jgi:PAS domain S-box-containing protein